MANSSRAAAGQTTSLHMEPSPTAAGTSMDCSAVAAAAAAASLDASGLTVRSGSSSRDASDTADDLSSEIGLLCLKAAGQGHSQYFGSSSSFSFSRIVFDSLRNVRSQGIGMTLGGLQDYNLLDLPQAIPAPLPPRQIGRIFTQAYFDNIHPQVSLG